MLLLLLLLSIKWMGVALETKCTVNACQRRQRLHAVLFVYFMVEAV